MRKERIIIMALVMLLVLAPSALAWTVSGTVYFTVNSTAVAAGGVPVNLTEADSTFIAQTTTAADGTYSFTTAIAPPPPKLITAFVQSQSKTVTKPTSPLGSDQVIDLTFAFSCPDSDGDSYYATWCGGTDCDDAEIALFAQLTVFADSDGDLFTSGAGVNFCTNGTIPSGYLAVQAPEDCNDANAGIKPGAAEVQCNGIDDDCSAGDFCPSEDDSSGGSRHRSSGGFVYSPPETAQTEEEPESQVTEEPEQPETPAEPQVNPEEVIQTGAEDITGAAVGGGSNNTPWVIGLIIMLGIVLGMIYLNYTGKKK